MITTHTRAALMNLAFGAQAWSTKPATLHFGLLTAEPTVAGLYSEVSGGGYARVALTANTTNFQEITTLGAAMENLVAITFGTSSAAWPTATHLGIFSAASGGNLLAAKALASPLTVGSGQVVSFGAGQLNLNFGGAVGAYLAQQWLNHWFCAEAFPSMTPLEIGLGTAVAPQEGKLYGEPGAPNYGRGRWTNGLALWPQTTDGVKINKTAASLDFNEASYPWSAFNAFAIFAPTYWTPSSPLITGEYPLWSSLISTATTHNQIAGANLVNDQEVYVHVTGGTSFTKGQVYYIVNADGSTFQISATIGGSAITASHTFYIRAEKSGNLIWGGLIDDTVTVVTNDDAIFSVDALNISLT